MKLNRRTFFKGLFVGISSLVMPKLPAATEPEVVTYGPSSMKNCFERWYSDYLSSKELYDKYHLHDNPYWDPEARLGTEQLTLFGYPVVFNDNLPEGTVIVAVDRYGYKYYEMRQEDEAKGYDYLEWYGGGPRPRWD